MLTLQYDGTRYLGWQRPQKDGYEKTVSCKLISILRKMTGEDLSLHAGAKTEPGVHAAGQTASFRTEAGFSPEQFRAELNRYLPQDIAVLDARVMPERFRADLSAISRTYEYRMCTAKVYDIFTAPYTAHIPGALDRDAMMEAASLLTGRHDFLGFSGARAKKKTEKEIFDLRITSGLKDPGSGYEDQVLTITVTADDFLFRMPSLIIGTLVEAGTGKRTPDSLRDILAGREKATAHCDAKGLLLRSVLYKNV